MKKYLNAIDYLSKVYWDNQAHAFVNMLYASMFGMWGFALSMCVVEMKQQDPIEWVRRGKRNDEEPTEEEIEQRHRQRKADLDFWKQQNQLAF